MLGAGIAGAEASTILRYGDSGDGDGNSQSVVGYLAAAFYRGIPPKDVRFRAYAQELLPQEHSPQELIPQEHLPPQTASLTS
jgi:hypothetical protein